ncbi:AMP-binding protein [Gordonia amarae]|uniref:AMP-binding protein n=2 Tax=Gordonia amarae TaxID=36821 RepID=A0A857KF92_9ACTN|nr:fatty acyl-CoA synthetase [Gordonia amarae]QHN15775.1 AMP-binding protein [Gordonia amarae]QHN24075.1 AMP-binding protein [Gordonia amarae]QHN29195.1 AMP-binding protein [Gordonia amarae]QHN37974.1 AMP-binding protein [Gordonia amarae]
MSAIHSSRVDDVLRRSAARSPHSTALTFEPRSWTYRELDDAVTRAAAELLAFDLDSQARVATYGSNSDAYVIAFLACSRAGLVHVPINNALTGDELNYLLTDSGASLVLADPGLAPQVAQVSDVPIVALRDADDSLLSRVRTADGPVPAIPEPDVDESGLVQLLYTSGTTSAPKGAMMSHRALVHEYFSTIVALDLTGNDAPLHVMPLYHSAGMHVWMMPYLAVGAANHLLPSADIATILERIETARAGSIFLAPTVWVPLSQHPDFAGRDLSSLRKAVYGASIMPVPVLERLQKALPDLGFYNAFGQSEIGPLATVLRPEEHAQRPASCGRPVLNVEIRVIGATGEPVEAGGQGEVVYRSPQLCDGYWNKPEMTAEAFRDGWFHSGDLVSIDAEGYITVVDRIKDVVNTGGVLVASREVEDALYTHPGVSEVAVIGVPDPKWIEAIVAFVVADSAVTEDELIAHTRSRLAAFKVPKRIVFIDQLPRNASGKLLKRVVRADYADSLGRGK